jgi:putative cardiolipin synthase
LLERLLEAADRGVRVRLLIDGFRLEGHEELDAALDLHPNLELRVFNPTLHRAGLLKGLEMVEHLGELDHRMHNKLFLVDGVVGVFGGRNVGDEYFGLGDELDFRDFDLLAAGPVLPELAESFDEFWNGEWTVPLASLVRLDPAQAETALAKARAALVAGHVDDGRLDGRRGLDTAEWLESLRRARSRMEPGEALVVHDAADIGTSGATCLMAHAFDEALARNSGDVVVVTAYLVPSDDLLERMRRHVAAGNRIRILTNSRETNNQPLAHRYYARSRRALLAAGVELYELRGDAFDHVRHRSPGSSGEALGLHAKSAVIGDDHVLVGSMNLDPRSMVLNTEIGVLIEGREIAVRVRACIEHEICDASAWRVTLAPDGSLQWHGQGRTYSEEPSGAGGQSFFTWLLDLLPLRGEV